MILFSGRSAFGFFVCHSLDGPHQAGVDIVQRRGEVPDGAIHHRHEHGDELQPTGQFGERLHLFRVVDTVAHQTAFYL